MFKIVCWWLKSGTKVLQKDWSKQTAARLPGRQNSTKFQTSVDSITVQLYAPGCACPATKKGDWRVEQSRKNVCPCYFSNWLCWFFASMRANPAFCAVLKYIFGWSWWHTKANWAIKHVFEWHFKLSEVKLSLLCYFLSLFFPTMWQTKIRTETKRLWRRPGRARS